VSFWGHQPLCAAANPDNETVWVSLNQIADLFQRDRSVISCHIKNVFDAGELRPEGTAAKSASVQTEGSTCHSEEDELASTPPRRRPPVG
jgi:hypothetical protein